MFRHQIYLISFLLLAMSPLVNASDLAALTQKSSASDAQAKTALAQEQQSSSFVKKYRSELLHAALGAKTGAMVSITCTKLKPKYGKKGFIPFAVLSTGLLTLDSILFHKIRKPMTGTDAVAYLAGLAAIGIGPLEFLGIK